MTADPRPINDPVRSAEAAARRCWWGALAVAGTASIWAAGPWLATERPFTDQGPEPATRPQRAPPEPAPPAVALAFRAPLWHAQPPPPPPPPPSVVPAPPPPPPPLRAQLLCIVEECRSGAAPEYAAGVFDADEQRVVFVRVGDTLGGRRVEAIDARSVTVGSGPLAQRLALPEPPSPGGDV